jgi:putative membrane protein
LAPVRRFAITLLILGVVLLILGILNRGRFMREVRRERIEMVAKGELHGALSFPVSIPLVAACALLVLGVITTLSLILRAEPFH